MAEHNSQYLIELDGNKPPEELFRYGLDWRKDARGCERQLAQRRGQQPGGPPAGGAVAEGEDLREVQRRIGQAVARVSASQGKSPGVQPSGDLSRTEEIHENVVSPANVVRVKEDVLQSRRA
ncbi:hypothetical protein CB1_000993023 [Camelus ferus]|nr:hypothetical protein CB1_000993023 [Camelus ferus]